ncbi:carbonyl reductase (NADPH-dependent) ari1 [Lignoscripta atroalba]|nr:carbonyl reductase (NADPH-dependent) ari1 [Lignoscripta atroalba]
MKAVAAEVDGYFLEHWPFPNEKARKKYLDAGFSRVTCCYYPKASDDRIHFGCRLLTLLFLIDDLLEDMSFEEGSAYNEHLIPISRGHVLPDRSVPVEYITYDLWESMRACDKDLADAILEPVFTFMRAQTDPVRKDVADLGPYLEYRERDVGKALLSALMRFVMGLHVAPAELDSVVALERNCSKHISVVNDIYSWEKELIASKTGHAEGSALCSGVLIMANEAKLSIEGSKRVLWQMCREWEQAHVDLVAETKAAGNAHTDLEEYMKGLEYQMSGNELWSQSTKRYLEVYE